MYTRQDYLNGKVDHQKYYSQFVNEDVKNEVLNFIGKNNLLDNTDKHLNNIPLKKWDALAGYCFDYQGNITERPSSIKPIDYSLLKEAKESVSASVLVCIYKEAARQLIKELKGGKDDTN